MYHFDGGGDANAFICVFLRTAFVAVSCCCNLHPPPPPRDALEGKGPQRGSQTQLDRRFEDVAKAVGGGYCRLPMPMKLALAARETVTGHGLGGLEGGAGTSPPSNASLPPPPPAAGFGGLGAHRGRGGAVK